LKGGGKRVAYLRNDWVRGWGGGGPLLIRPQKRGQEKLDKEVFNIGGSTERIVVQGSLRWKEKEGEENE